MCGICGYTRINKYVSEEVIVAMKKAIAHRGPDDHGTYTDENIVLGHQRLAVIDLESGKQPLTNEDGRFWLIANGEIYNYRSLKSDLEAKGHIFSTHSDSEVLLHLYETYQEEMLERIQGMYAFAIWDTHKKTLFLARDRYGQKPLYYAQIQNQIVFASELKAILKYPGLKKEINSLALRQYLAYEYVPEPLSIFENINKLEAGCFLTWQKGEIRNKRYWDFPVTAPKFKGSQKECCEELLRLLDESVKKRLMSDVPLGIFLSGGLDSSLITALACRHVTSRKIKTFSIGFQERSYDETRYSKYVSDYLGTDHISETLTSSQMIEILPEITKLYDEPFADASAIPTYLVSKLAKKHVTVALSGDGSDELFAGYDPFPAHQISRLFECLPKFVNEKIFRNIIRMITPSDNNMSFEFRANKFFKYLYHPPVYKNQMWLGCFDASMQNECLIHKDGHTSDVYSGLMELVRTTKGLNPIEAIIYAYIKTYLRDDILTKVDRASMAHGLEVRSPFLDSSMSQFIASIPSSWKLNRLVTKYILKKSARSVLPNSVINRKKKGFGIPKANWLRGILREDIESSFTAQRIKEQGLFDYQYVQQLIRDHMDRRRDHQKEIWTLFMFDKWYRNYMV
ncbi:MAG: asparagine synthase (glutamine-hydrolyzing) [Proteobacteria bacterium]|nr:asparagine synthase (glutamine-hydrolyzing) [Desulfobacula sp.]MBU4133637.1 asparagine synthase (glutamine-hydrolyzing) [Pseudomonadota bacterium]